MVESWVTEDEMRALGRALIAKGYGQAERDSFDDYPGIVTARGVVMPGWMAETIARVELVRQGEESVLGVDGGIGKRV